MKKQSIDTSPLNLPEKEITYEKLLKTAFDPNTPDVYAKYLQDLLIEQRQIAKKIGWEMECFSFVLNYETGKIIVWG